MKLAATSNFFHDKPLFGLDIGHGSLKVMQLETVKNGHPKDRPKVIGYGFMAFDDQAQLDGVITKPDVIAKSALDLFKHHLVGDVTTHRVAIAIPAYRTFSRSIDLPKLSPRQLKEAIELEAEQYIPVPLDQLYLDYEVIKQSADSMQLFMVAVPKTIVDSYLELTQILGLEAVLIEPTINSSGRLFALDEQSDVPAFVIDFGSVSADISIYDKQLLVAGTVQGGGNSFTETIKAKLGVSREEAWQIKTRYGLNTSKQQAQIREALEPVLSQIVKEIRRMIRYYEERYGADRPITQIITLGGGANMPGLSDYLTATMRLAVRQLEPWFYLDYKGLQPPAQADKTMYSTVAGLSLTDPVEVFND